MGASESGAAGRIILAATPLGNPADASARLRDALASTPLIAAEDTRRVRRLASDLDVRITGKVVSLFDAVEAQRAGGLIEAAIAGDNVLIVSDAGMPAVNDPGYRVVRAAIDAGIQVQVLPGPSAVLTALVISGLPVDRFCFEGFPPRKAGERRRLLASLASEPRTMVFFESPHRVAATLADMADAFGGDRLAAVCRELTKTYEEVWRGTLSELQSRASGDVKGEITVVVAGATSSVETGTPEDWARAVEAREQAGSDRKAAIAEVAREVGVPRREVYDAVVAARHQPTRP